MSEHSTSRPLLQEDGTLRRRAAPGLTAGFLFLYLALFFIPGWVFLRERGGLVVLSGVDTKTAEQFLFPLFGLYAFFFVWAQLMIGSNIAALRRRWRWIERFHRIEGVFALLFAVMHPLLLVFSIGIGAYLRKEFVHPSLAPYVLIGQIQLVLIILTAGTALLMKIPWLKTRWHIIHHFNYLVFALAWIHSWFLGSDVQPTPLRYFWFAFAITAAASIVGRVSRAARSANRENENRPW